jgi:hypothetical protein
VELLPEQGLRRWGFDALEFLWELVVYVRVRMGRK